MSTNDDDVREMKINSKTHSGMTNKRLSQEHERMKNMKPGSQGHSKNSSPLNKSGTIPTNETGMLTSSIPREDDKQNIRK